MKKAASHPQVCTYIRINFVDHVACTQLAAQAVFHALLGHRHVSFQKHLVLSH